ncbi:helix-turn-helix domain-containing protein [Chryseobacterium manosquense]|uniref:Helix-turn-helix domain-containing protein n=2 Tax=Chryseobacterium manosquense TaxID=2754694 RepID=A0A7H1DXD9_9FLAO|nr:helix-turn-helix domain-containing protein [Chryseobacterium manosquense]
MLIKKYHLISILIFLLSFSFKMKAQNTYDDIRKKYKIYEQNDERALPVVRLFISKAKKENNYEKLVKGYEDAFYYSNDATLKLKYADSCINASLKTNDYDVISRSYLGKGTIYYFNLKRYEPALDQYVKAYEYSKKGNDDYQEYKVIYHMGVVKSYLGYYNEALKHFEDCIQYFEPKTKGDLHPNTIFNNSKGYLNSLHQATICYRNLGNYKMADSLVNVGLNFTSKSKEFPLEQAYFTKCKGIFEYHQKNYDDAIQNLTSALPVLKKNNDFSWTSVADFYIGKSYLGLGKQEQAIQQFEKVDSIFQKHKFIVPELRENYELLIKYWKEKKNDKQELHYTKNLLKADSILAKDFPYLSAKIHKDYDTQILEDAKGKLEKQNYWSLGAILLLILAVIGLIFIAWKLYQKEKLIRKKYSELEERLQTHQPTPAVSYENIPQQSKAVISKDVFTDLAEKLKEFEDTKSFKEKGITLPQLAENFKTNTTYLSQYINDVMGVNFNKYISTLRINYVTDLMYNDAKVLSYSVQGLADECGISSRQNFSDLFLEINGIRPTDFIKQRKKELE